jgi:very-short-patch-repair endonuclease
MTNNIDKKIDDWKEQLIDLTRRNNMVDFSATKTKTLPTENDNWREFAGELAAGTELYVWRPEEEEDDAEGEDTDTEEEETEDQEEEETTNSIDVAERPDQDLIPTRNADETANSLYNITLNQRKHLQEKGIDSLYLSLGMLEWYSVDYSDTKLRSPLFLASVSIERTTVSDPTRHDYEVASGDEIILNPALRKKLKTEFGITLPENDSFDLTDVGEAADEIRESIDGRGDWAITGDVILGIFDFAKLSLYNDLEEHREEIKSNPVVRAINGDTSGLNTDVGNVPTAEHLDDTVSPTDTFQVLEADSSQQEAIEAAKEGVSFVLQGPPGTGKSQTIANIIAEKLADGEKVLFVSEKQAALEVVQNRLDEAGLGRFCLPAHGRQASKDSVLQSLEAEMNSPQVKEPEDRPRKLGELRKRRAELNEYGELLTRSFGEVRTSAYDAHGIVANLEDVETPRWSVADPLSVTEATFQEALDTLEKLSQFEEQFQAYDSHPWRHTTVEQWQIDTTDKMRESLDAQLSVLTEIESHGQTITEETGIDTPSISEFDGVIGSLKVLADRPEVDWTERLFDSGFYRRETQVASLAETSRELAELRSELAENYDESIYTEDGQQLHSDIASYGILRYVQPSYRRLKKQVLAHAAESYSPGKSELQDDLQTLAEIQRLEDEIAGAKDVRASLGHLYEGTDTDWDLVLRTREWVETALSSTPLTEDELFDVVTDETVDVEDLITRAETLQSEWDDAVSYFESAVDTSSITTESGDAVFDASMDETRGTLESLRQRVPELQEWVQFSQLLESTTETTYETYVSRFLDDDFDPADLVDGFRKIFYTEFINQIYGQTALGEFSSSQHQQALDRFRRLDKEQQELAKVEIQHRVTAQRPTLDLEHASGSGQVVLRREIEKQRRRKPLRQLFDEAGDMITKLKPCFMMSPLSVAQHLQTDTIDFDVVVFDEASQIMPQDAISSIIRADQAIVAGDTKQLPPTQFFSGDVEADDDVREDLESILDETAAVLPEKHLRWHYRSRTDELIDFSNQKYYGGRLNTFPENDPAVPTGVDFEFVEEGVYDRGGSRQNVPEARRIVDHVQKFAEEFPDRSLGVVAFSSAQERAIRDLIEERRRDDPALDDFVDDTDTLEGFFVKSLESVQGDERDVMLFSVGYGPDQSGKITMNFGPLNKDGGERRLNVAVTRAREKVVVFSSLQPGDIDTSRTQARGVRDFKNYLEYAKKGRRALARDDEVTETLAFDSTFEESVYDALEDEGYDVVTQVQSSGYSIDLAIKHPERPGEFVLGIECDGAAYHSSKTARDRDRTRQLILEDLGWTIHRIWSPDWASNRGQEIDKIATKIDGILDGKREEVDESADVSVPEAEAEPTDPVQDGGAVLFDEYTEPTVRTGRDREIDSIPKAKIRRKLTDVTENYGPLATDEAYSRVARSWQYSRVGKRIRRTFDRASDRLDGQQVVVNDGFLWPSDLEEVPARLNTDTDSRSVDEIPIEELAKCAYTILEHSIPMSREDLILETARRFGWSRRGEKIQTRLEEAVDYLERIGAVGDGEKVTPKDVDIDSVILRDVRR